MTHNEHWRTLHYNCGCIIKEGTNYTTNGTRHNTAYPNYTHCTQLHNNDDNPTRGDFHINEWQLTPKNPTTPPTHTDDIDDLQNQIDDLTEIVNNLYTWLEILHPEYPQGPFKSKPIQNRTTPPDTNPHKQPTKPQTNNTDDINDLQNQINELCQTRLEDSLRIHQLEIQLQTQPHNQ